jgi:hypothetical protein
MDKIPNDIQEFLLDYLICKIQEISERKFHSPWIKGIEFKVWDAINDQEISNLVSADEAAFLRTASRATNSWITLDSGLSGQGEIVVIPISEWKKKCLT